MKMYIAVAIGGIIGSVCRYMVSLLFSLESSYDFPWATLVVNVSGAFLLTFLLFHPIVKSKLDATLFTGITTGLIGSYTTFSTITVEVVTLATKNLLLSIVYVGLTIFLGLFSSFAGYKLASIGERRQ